MPFSFSFLMKFFMQVFTVILVLGFGCRIFTVLMGFFEKCLKMKVF